MKQQKISLVELMNFKEAIYSHKDIKSMKILEKYNH